MVDGSYLICQMHWRIVHFFWILFFSSLNDFFCLFNQLKVTTTFDFSVNLNMDMFIFCDYYPFIINTERKREREGSPFDWFDWIEFALTWQVSEQDETYRKNEKERTRNRSAICQHQSSPVVIHLVLYRADGRTKLKFAKLPIIYNQRGGNRSTKFDIYRSVWHTQKFNLLWSILFFFIFLFFTLVPRWCQRSSRTMAL